MLPTFLIESIEGEDYSKVQSFLIEHWGSQQVVSRGKLHDAASLPGFLAISGQSIQEFLPRAIIGLITFEIRGKSCEIVTINSLVGGIGIGTQLIKAVASASKMQGCQRLWLITTNDNTPALKFYQKRGFCLAAIHSGAMVTSRQLKPGIPIIGVDGIPIRDEIELELDLTLETLSIPEETRPGAA